VFNKKGRRESSTLEICLKGAKLTDVGLAEVVDSILEGLVEHDGIPTFQLEELDLSGNSLTTAALRRLAPVIRRSQYDLKDLNLSENNIRVETQEERDDWEAFLDSFRFCRRMRRLDLSRNDLSKSLPLEILLRVYCQHRWIDPVNLETCTTPVHSTKRGILEMTNSLNLSLSLSSSNGTLKSYDPHASLTSLSNGRILEAREGLRSIPYIILSHACIGDAGVLHLSYILAHHYWPQNLITELKKGSCEAQRRIEDDATQCFGIVYTQNDEVSSFGKKLLEHAEAARQELIAISEASESKKNLSFDSMENWTSKSYVVAL
jgi:hypothetical protein